MINPPKRADLSQGKPFSIQNKHAKVDLSLMARVPNVYLPLADFFDYLPNIAKAYELRYAGHTLAHAFNNHKTIIALIDERIIKLGLSPLVVRMMEEELIGCVCMNGTAMIKDYELATYGNAMSELDTSLENGQLGMEQEIAETLNRTMREGIKVGCGLGEAIGRGIRHLQIPYERFSITANAHRLGIPLTIHTTIGGESIHQSATFEADICAKGSHRDFRLLAGLMPQLNDGGVVLNLSKGNLLTDVFTYALNIARNMGSTIINFSAIDLDTDTADTEHAAWARRAVKPTGQALYLRGHHELMLPLLYSCAKAYLRDNR